MKLFSSMNFQVLNKELRHLIVIKHGAMKLNIIANSKVWIALT